MSKTIVAVLLAIVTGCAHRMPVVSARSVMPAEALTPDEVRVVAALLNDEARQFAQHRPILILTPTDSRLPRYRDLAPAALDRLRIANDKPASLSGIPLPAGAVLFPAEEFARATRSHRDFQRLVRRFGGVEPLVLRVSRPVVADGKGLVALHINSTWSGCGGINLYSVGGKSLDEVELKEVLVVW